MYGEKTRQYLGEFELGEKAVITDPCYDRPEVTNRNNAVVDVDPGKWDAHIVISNEALWGNRVAELQISKAGTIPAGYSRSWEFIATCGVDSGQLGVFDYGKYPIGVNGYDSDYDDPENWYRRACNETYDEEDLSKKAGIVESMGVNSSSGFGDGAYEVLVARNGEDKVVGIKVVFIPEDEDYD
jgi:Protein of unknown function (DUF4241)